MRNTHGELLKRHRQNGGTPAFLAEVEEFLRRGQATGALLDDEHDRWTAQSLLDYWMTTLYRAGQEPRDATLDEFDPALAPELDDALCPYLGLDAFSEENAGLFFGRQRLIDSLTRRTESHRLLAIVGPSGSGKSSVVRAGLLPRLKGGALPGSQMWHYPPPMIPGSQPLASLALLLRPPEVNMVAWNQIQIERLKQDPDTLAVLLDKMIDRPSVLVVDQFEELFTLCEDEHTRQRFIDNLLKLVDAPAAKHTIILTMRSDFETFVTRSPTLHPLFETAKVYVPPLSAGDLRDAIEKPAEQVGLKFETGVVDELIQEILGEPAALPLLQFTLLKLWENRERNRVTMATYRQIGGGRLALARSADEFYNSLIPEEQVTAKRILLRMVRPGEGLEVTSSRIRRADLYRAGEARDRVDRVLSKLIQARLVRLTAGDVSSDAQVEVAHEALVRNWPTLVDWLEDEREILRQRQRLTSAAEQWNARGRDVNLLLRGAPAFEALRYPDLNRLERDFVRASLAEIERTEQEKEALQQREEAARQRELAQAHELAAEQQRRAEAERERAEAQSRLGRRLRRLAVALAVVSMIAIITAVYAGFQWQIIVEAEGDVNSLRTSEAELAENSRNAQATNQAAQVTSQAAETARSAAVSIRSTAVIEIATAQAQNTAAASAAAQAEAARITAERGREEAEQQAATARQQSTAAAHNVETAEAVRTMAEQEAAAAYQQSTAAAIELANATAELAGALASRNVYMTQAAETRATSAAVMATVQVVQTMIAEPPAAPTPVP
jgi:energy-coupling factor transporter ATP-binding protein EcfA2